MPLRAVLVLLLGVLVNGCALARRELAAGEAAVRVENRLDPPTGITVYAEAADGTRRLLGPVYANSSQTFFFEPGTAGEYRLVARPTAGAEIRSNPVALPVGATVQWDVKANTVAPFTPT